MISALLPEGSCSAETHSTNGDEFLLPEEASALGDVSAKRLAEFTRARSCARHALARLGVAPRPILIGPHREPLWPPEVVGSITHCAGYCAAVVAPSRLLAAIGIDAETNAPLPPEVASQILLPKERQRLDELGNDGIHWDRIIFSAKECVYKAWFPLTRRWLDFTDAEITLDPLSGTFTARLLVPAPRLGGVTVNSFTGRYLVRDGLVVTSAWRAIAMNGHARPRHSPTAGAGSRHEGRVGSLFGSPDPMNTGPSRSVFASPKAYKSPLPATADRHEAHHDDKNNLLKAGARRKFS